MSIIEKAISRPARDERDESPIPRASVKEAIEKGEDFVCDEALEWPSEIADNGGLDRGSDASELNKSDEIEAHIDAPQSGHTSLSIRPRVELPLAALQKQGFLAPTASRSRIAEEFRGIKRPILQKINGRGSTATPEANLVMVTSALQGDGKTFSSINLAISIAMEQDKTVLFVDADVVRATAGRTLGIHKSTPGLIDLLSGAGELDPSDVILHTNIEKLRVLPAGNASRNSTELLASETMHEFMIELSNRYPDRVIVFDSPPLLLTTEASVLASFMGQIVFVASADVTPQHAVEEALEQLGEDKMVGVVLNRASRRRTKLLGIGSYGYGYGYGYGYEHEDTSDTDQPRRK